MAFKVKATQTGYYGDLRYAGAAFEIDKLADYSKHWMEPIDWNPSEEKAKAERAERAAAEKLQSEMARLDAEKSGAEKDEAEKADASKAKKP